MAAASGADISVEAVSLSLRSRKSPVATVVCLPSNSLGITVNSVIDS